MLEKVKNALIACPCDGAIYLMHKLSDCSGFFMSQKHLVYMAYNNEGAAHQILATEFLRLNTNIEITAIENNQQFESGKYNVIEILPVDGVYDDASLDSFINLCVAHTQFMGASGFVKFFYSLVNLFQFPMEQRFVNLVGLFGELSFLKYVSQVMNKDFSDRWHKTGSTDKYDIALDSCNLEIKTTMSVEELVTIKHSQLFNMDRNFLVAVLVEESNGGKTLNQLIAEMQLHSEHFKSFSFALNLEKEKKRVSPIDAETKRFSFKSVTIYDANIINPFKELPENISSMEYKLDLFELPSVDLKTFEKEIKNV